MKCLLTSCQCTHGKIISLGIGLPVKVHKTHAGHIPITHPETCHLSVFIPRIKCRLISGNVTKAVCVCESGGRKTVTFQITFRIYAQSENTIK